MKVHVVMRKMTLRNGSAVAYPVKFTESAPAAKEQCIKMNEDLGFLMGARLVVPTPEGGKDTRITVSTFLENLGVMTLEHGVQEVDVSDTDIVAPKPSLILLNS